MGWLILLVIRPLVRAVEPGFLSYSFGFIFYAWKRLPFGHVVWHFFSVTIVKNAILTYGTCDIR
jgi:hemolysin III